jgi:DNA-binding transcriptional ArsR family regulator
MSADIFKAIADPRRRTILDLLVHQPLSLKNIAEHFAVSRPAISKHVKILVECGLIEIHQRGRERYCEVQPEMLNEVSGWIEQYQQNWEARYERLDELLENLKKTEKLS